MYWPKCTQILRLRSFKPDHLSNLWEQSVTRGLFCFYLIMVEVISQQAFSLHLSNTQQNLHLEWISVVSLLITTALVPESQQSSKCSPNNSHAPGTGSACVVSAFSVSMKHDRKVQIMNCIRGQMTWLVRTDFIFNPCGGWQKKK